MQGGTANDWEALINNQSSLLTETKNLVGHTSKILSESQAQNETASRILSESQAQSEQNKTTLRLAQVTLLVAVLTLLASLVLPFFVK